MTSITFGRPTVVPRDTPIPLPTPIDDEYLSTTTQGRQPENVPSRLDFFIYALKLLGILERLQTYEHCRHGDQHNTTHGGKDLGDMLSLITDLDSFSQELPSHLQSGDNTRPPNSTSCFELQGRVLKAR